MKILIVDDSLTFRRFIKLALEAIPNVEIVGTASNGKAAMDILRKDPSINLITLDINMPICGGLETIKMMKEHNFNQKIIVFASKTSRSIKETVEALSLGADDFVLKPDGESSSLSIEDQIKKSLNNKVITLLNKVKSPHTKPQLRTSPPAIKKNKETKQVNQTTASQRLQSLVSKKNIDLFKPSIIVIASSTGGPNALMKFFANVKMPPRIPVLIAQHMPENFTKFLAQRIKGLTGVPCREAENKETLMTGTIYIAPGNYHMRLVKDGQQVKINLDQKERSKGVRPCADFLFTSAAEIFKSHTMGFVLTGMGDDGCIGTAEIKKNNGGVMIQDKESSVVWGMPGAVHEDGSFDKMGSIDDCAKVLARMCA